MPTISLKLTQPELELLDQLTRIERNQNRSDTIRQAIVERAEKHPLKKDTLAKLRRERELHPPRYRLRRPHADDPR